MPALGLSHAEARCSISAPASTSFGCSAVSSRCMRATSASAASSLESPASYLQAQEMSTHHTFAILKGYCLLKFSSPCGSRAAGGASHAPRALLVDAAALGGEKFAVGLEKLEVAGRCRVRVPLLLPAYLICKVLEH